MNNQFYPEDQFKVENTGFPRRSAGSGETEKEEEEEEEQGSMQPNIPPDFFSRLDGGYRL